MGKEGTNIGLSLLLGNFDNFDKDLVQSLSSIGNRFESVYSAPQQENVENENWLDTHRKSKEECEQEYKTLFLGGIIEKISKQTYSKMQSNELQVQNGLESLFFESNVQVCSDLKNNTKGETNGNDVSFKCESSSCSVGSERLMVNNLDIVNWENQIIWEENNEGKTYTKQEGFCLSPIRHESDSNNWGFINDSSEEDYTKRNLQPSPKLLTESLVPASLNHLPASISLLTSEDGSKKKRKYRKKRNNYDKPLISSFTSNEASKIKKTKLIEENKQEISKFLNEELMEGKWLELIGWNSELVHYPTTREKKLILDLNDKSMIFDIDNPTINHDCKDNVDFESMESFIRSSCEEENYKKETIPKRYLVKHSKPAQKLDSKHYKLFPSNSDISKWKKKSSTAHFSKNDSFDLNYSNPKRKIKSIQSNKDLSVLDNRLILMEYVERNPPLLNKHGMGTIVVNYCNKPKSITDETPKFKDGITSMVDNEEIPLICNLSSGSTITTTQNNMFSAQIYEQSMQRVDKNYQDFMLCSRRNSKGKMEFFIREIPVEYLVGHIQPRMEVYPPRSRPFDSYISNALTYHIGQIFHNKIKAGRSAKVRANEITSTFNDSIPPQTVRNKLKELATFNRKNDIWVANAKTLPNEEEISKLITPEMICVNEAMFSGDFKLNNHNMDARSDMVAYELSHAKLEERTRQIIKSIERTKNSLPWSQTNNFQLCFKSSQENVKLELLEIVQENVKNLQQFIQQVSRQIVKETEELHQSITNSQARQILIDSNSFNEEQFNSMSKSERISNARRILNLNQKSGLNNSDGTDEDLGKRNARTLARINVFKKALQDVYMREAIKLENGLNYYESSEHYLDELIFKKTGQSSTFVLPLPSLEEGVDSLSSHSSTETISKKALSLTSDIKQLLSDNNSETSNINQSTTNPTRRGRKKKNLTQHDSIIGNQYVKKTILSSPPRIEYIYDPARVNYYRQVHKSKRRSKHFVGADDCEILSVGPREHSRLQALSKEFKKKFNSNSQTEKEQAIEKLFFRDSEKSTNTTIKNAFTSSRTSSSISNNKRTKQATTILVEVDHQSKKKKTM